jgi:hypothetical protein
MTGISAAGAQPSQPGPQPYVRDPSANTPTPPGLRFRSRREEPSPLGKTIDQLCKLYTGRQIDKFFVDGGAVRAAAALMHTKSVLLLTGFNVEAGMPETDGPPGTAVLANALAELGMHVTLVVDQTNEPVMQRCYAQLDPDWKNVDLKVFDVERGAPSEGLRARNLLSETGADAVVAVELPGRNVDGIPKNMRGLDIGGFNAPLDAILLEANVSRANPVTVGVGDGGNEAGMGNLRGIPSARDGSLMASDVPAGIPVTAWNSNLGAQSIAAVMLGLGGRIEHLTSGHQLTAVTRAALNAGAVDGVTRGRVAGEPGEGPGQVTGVDGFALSVHAGNLDYLKQIAVQL